MIYSEVKELSHSTDDLTGQEKSKHKSGFFDFMTNELVTREDAYIGGVIMALSRFLHQDLW